MKKMILGFVFLVSVLFSAGNTSAAVIVDTLEPPPIPQGSSWFYGYDQWLASRFTLSQDYNITDMYGWIWEGISSRPDGNVDDPSSIARITLYGDGGTLPNEANELFGGQFFVPNNDPDDRPQEGVSPYNWYGLSGQNIFLPAGSYWIAFESRRGIDSYYGAFGYPAPSGGLPVEAFKSGSNPYRSGDMDLSLRIYGNPAGNSVIPEPSTLLLLGSGLLGLAFRRKF